MKIQQLHLYLKPPRCIILITPLDGTIRNVANFDSYSKFYDTRHITFRIRRYFIDESICYMFTRLKFVFCITCVNNVLIKFIYTRILQFRWKTKTYYVYIIYYLYDYTIIYFFYCDNIRRDNAICMTIKNLLSSRDEKKI